MKNSYKILLGLIALGIIIITLVLSGKSKGPAFKLANDESLKNALNANIYVTVDELKAGLAKGWLAIDIRDSYSYAKNCIEKAENIPANNIISSANIDFLSELVPETVVVLYGEETMDAFAPWFLLHQMGYSNFKILKGGFTGWTSGKFMEPEKAEFDFAKVLSESNSTPNKISVNKEIKKKKESVKLKQVVKPAAEGGC
jgi:rhodanese-related sulfurtransferase